MVLWKNGAFENDPWRYVREGEDASPAGHVILGLDWWRSLRDVFLQSNVPVGIKLEADEALNEIANDLPRFSLIALAFPAYTDGRSFSKAQKLREDYGFQGEIRATGDVLVDQIMMFQRCGFDALEIQDSNTEAALRQGHYWQQQRFYQPSALTEAPAGTRPWLRQSLAKANA